MYPRGGWSRAISYIGHRLRRLPDAPHKISRGIAAGIFVCWTPIYGFHFLAAAALAWIMRGNVLAALLATFFGNPLTFPIIAVISVELGSLILGRPGGIPLPEIVAAFSAASVELWTNFIAMFTSEPTQWHRLADFFHQVFLPYLVGGLIPGVISGLLGYALSRPVIAAYKKSRIKRLKRKYEQRLARQQATAGKTAPET